MQATREIISDWRTPKEGGRVVFSAKATYQAPHAWQHNYQGLRIVLLGQLLALQEEEKGAGVEDV